ncbi:DUF4352 domain-containing protein [Neobacillus notoginsengisoli]|uniref:DUF4352 domain-containing protein n=1 Tax=Neobacillus notoginsengisoli TaxID=1578198 RepID=A0A417YWL6_9BACI|nr:DUF4352 domain-containing protein [Neobacillus notoginsengisoli]RHW41668.1 DUF4352 domain-containing protein [Neobacillus notoginsengisoli]
MRLIGTKNLFAGLLGASVIFALGGCGAEEKPEKVSQAAGAFSEENKLEAKEEKPEKEIFAVGEQVKLGDNILTVSKVAKSNGSEFDKPKAGHEFVIVTVEINNSGKKNISYNPLDFKMANSQGQIVDQAFTTVDSDTALQSGELAPGGKVSGTLSFEQPVGDKGLELHYTPDFWSDSTVKINLQ